MPPMPPMSEGGSDRAPAGAPAPDAPAAGGAPEGGSERRPRLQYYHYRAMELRLAGWSYDDIARELGWSPKTVRSWWWDHADFRAEWEAIQQERISRARDILVQVAPVAAKTIAGLAQSADSERTRLAAAQDVLDRVVGRAPTRLEHTGAGGGPVETVILPPAEVERRLRDLGL